MTPEQLAKIEARAAAATPGPWEWEPTRRGVEWEDESVLPFFPQGAMLGETLIQLGDTYEGYRQDCTFIAHARRDIPDLCAEVRRLQGIITDIKDNPRAMAILERFALGVYQQLKEGDL